jgi:hypothetical protein
VPPQCWSLLLVGQRDQGWRDDHDGKYFPCLGAFQWRRDAFCCDPDHSIQRDKASRHSIRVIALWLVLQLERAPCLPQLVYRKAFAMIAMQTPSATPSTGIATMPKISASGSVATHAMNDIGRGLSGFEAMWVDLQSPPTTNFCRPKGFHMVPERHCNKRVYLLAVRIILSYLGRALWPGQSRPPTPLCSGHAIPQLPGCGAGRPYPSPAFSQPLALLFTRPARLAEHCSCNEILVLIEARAPRALAKWNSVAQLSV